VRDPDSDGWLGAEDEVPETEEEGVARGGCPKSYNTARSFE